MYNHLPKSCCRLEILSPYEFQHIIPPCLVTGDYFPALPVGGASPGGGRPGAAVGGDWPIMPRRHGRPRHPHANADHVRKALLQVQVTHNVDRSLSLRFFKISREFGECLPPFSCPIQNQKNIPMAL